MKQLTITPNSFVLEFTKAELKHIANALNEVSNGINIPEFETRVGCSRESLVGLLSQINKAFES